jgi:sulfide:quinone oxidoreductase
MARGACRATLVSMFSGTDSNRLRVLIAGGGVAGVECLLGLHDLAGDRLDITLVSESRELVEGAVALGEPFGGGPAQRIDLSRLASECGAWFVHGHLDTVDADSRSATMRDGATLAYDVLVTAVGAAPRLPWGHALTLNVTSPRMVDRMLREVRDTGAHRLVIGLPPGPHWPLPGYELALMLARDDRCPQLAVDVVTPERAPLQVFGPVASEAVAAQLADAGVTLHASRRMQLDDGDPVRVQLRPGREAFDADLVIGVPDLRPHTLHGLPIDERGFLPVDAHGQISGIRDVYAAGDCAAFPIKQGGLAAQQADAVALHIARRAGADVEPETTRVVLRARLLTGAEDLWLRRDLLRPGDPGEAAQHALWWPPGKVAGRWIAPYLQAQRDAQAGFPHPVARGRTLAPGTPADAVTVPRGLDLLGEPTRDDAPRP